MSEAFIAVGYLLCGYITTRLVIPLLAEDDPGDRPPFLVLWLGWPIGVVIGSLFALYWLTERAFRGPMDEARRRAKIRKEIEAELERRLGQL